MDDMAHKSATCYQTIQSRGIYDIFGDPQVVPRVGAEYQAEILSFTPECGCLELMKKRTVWTDIERASFLLGLYLFWKNLRLVQQFVESKKMGDILAYYYGKFYGSSDYIKWSAMRKTKTERSAHREKIFAVLKHPELLPSHASEECKSQMIEVSRKFSEGELSLEEYLFSLRNMVGINKLVEAISIGREKKGRDTAIGPSKANLKCQSWSSLTASEIIKILTSGLQLRKKRLNDIFWEAVWPRLLARGWHSEQPREKCCLVFIVPGIEEFSRSLVRGSQYFNTISDVLKKVASEPELLEFGDALVTHGEHFMDLSEKDHSTCNQDIMEFTIVDTSLLSGRGKVITREMRSLPLDPLRECTEPACSSAENRLDPLKHATKETVSCHDEAGGENDSSKNPLLARPDCSNITVADQHDGNSGTLDGKRSRTLIKFQFSRRRKNHQSNHSGQIKDDQSLTGGGHEENSKLNLQESCCSEKNKDTKQARNFLLEGYSKSCLEDNSVGSDCENNPGTIPFVEKSGPKIMIDLNYTQDPHDTEISQDFGQNVVSNHHVDSSVNKSFLLSETNHQYEALSNPLEEQACRRQSKRSKPSTKVLEAIAYGLLGKKQKRKEMEGISRI